MTSVTRESIQRSLAHPGVTTAIAWATAFVTIAFLVLGVLYWPRIAEGQTTQLETQQVQGCRSASNSLVTAARTDFDVARAARDTEATHLNLLIAQALESVAVRDGTLPTVVAQIREQRELVRRAEVVVVDATRDLREAQVEHERRTLLSLEHPSDFLSECHTFARGT